MRHLLARLARAVCNAAGKIANWAYDLAKVATRVEMDAADLAHRLDPDAHPRQSWPGQ